jgi:predicted P-loop ATPase
VLNKREAVRLDALRRDRDQIFAEALHRLQAGERYWPTPEEEEAVLKPNQRQGMPESAIEIVNILERYIFEKPRTTIPQKGHSIGYGIRGHNL